MRKLLYIFVAISLSLGLSAQTKEVKPFLRGVTLYCDEQYEQAYSVFTVLSEMYPEDDAIAYYYGCTANKCGKNDIAETQLKKAYQLDTNNTHYLYSLAFFYNETENVPEFANYSELLVKKAPEYLNSAETLALIADAQLMVGSDSLALNLYDRLLDIVPDYPPAIVSKMYIYRHTGKLVNFFVCLEQMIENEGIRADYKNNYLTEIVDNMSPQFYWVWGDTLLKIIDRNLEINPSEPAAHFLRIRFSLIKDEDEDAIDRSYKMIEVANSKNDNKSVADAYSLIGDLYHEKGNKKLTYSSYNAALKAFPDHAAVLNNYAYYLSEDRKSLRKALKMSTKVVELEPDNATYLDTHGWILFLLGRAEEAKPYFKRAMIYGGKESAVILDHYSQVLNKLGETDLAKYYKSLSEQKSK